MQAANRGAKLAGAGVGGHPRGAAVRAGRQSLRRAGVRTRNLFTRLQHFVIASDAFVVVPGGIGTVLETLMIWLLQVRHVDNVPLILVGKMWRASSSGRGPACRIRGWRSPTRETSRSRGASTRRTKQSLSSGSFITPGKRSLRAFESGTGHQPQRTPRTQSRSGLPL